MRLVRGGPWVAARITCALDGMWQATINGENFAADADPLHAEGVVRIWHSGRPITPDEYNHMLAVKTWAGEHLPEHPAAQPRQPIDLRYAQPLF